MNASVNQVFLSDDEVLFHRMEFFHRERVEAIAQGQSPLGKREDGFLVVHLLPLICFQCRSRFEGTKLKEHGAKVSAFGARGGYAVSRFNVDGLLNLDSERSPESYVQFYRDGRLESVMSAITFQTDRPDPQAGKQPRFLRDVNCEMAVFKLVPEYLSFCQGIGIAMPVMLFSALIGCKGVGFYTEWGYRFGPSAIDRSPAFLPEMEIGSVDGGPEKALRPWCDYLSQAMGFEKSHNYDNDGNWRERRR